MKMNYLFSSQSLCPMLALFVCLAPCFPIQAATKTIVLKEEINQNWANELLSYPFEAAQGQAIAESISVSGPNGVVPAQFSDIEFWPETKFVKSARVLFVAQLLEPLATLNYQVSYGTTAAAKTNADLKVTSGDGWVELSTSRIGARLLTGEKTYEAPVSPKDVPGPLQSLRLTDGNWNGGSALYGEVKVKSYSARLVESGPVRARVECRYVLADDTAATFTGDLTSGDNKLLWKVDASQDRPAVGVDFQLGKLPGVKQVAVPKGWGQWAKIRTIELTPSNEPFARLAPEHSIVHVFADSPASIVMKAEAGPELRIASRDPGAWVDPVKPFTYGGFETWNLDMIPKSWENWKRKQVPMTYAPDGSVSMKVSFASGRRLWSVGNGASVVGERLNEVKDMVLDWSQQDKRRHPYLFMSQTELEETWKRRTPDPTQNQTYINQSGLPNGWATVAYLYSGGSKEVAAKSKVVEQLRNQLGLLGDYDTMRYGIAAVGMYDALIDSDLITPSERSLFRAQLAYLGYKSADPVTWSIERGYHGGNPNMSISYTLTLGIIACAIPDHPMAKTWSDYATHWMDKWLTDEVGKNGEWLPEGGHYGQVSWVQMVAYALAAKRAGFHDFLDDVRFKKLALFFARQWTPPDPQRKGVRVAAPVGRGTSGDTNGAFGVLARATAQSDPEFSKIMQWMWAQNGYEANIGDFRLGGFEQVYADRNLPSQRPDWKSELFPAQGAVLRDAVGDPNEHYVNVLATTDSLRNLDIWTPEIGNIASWFAFGKPISTQFTFGVGYNERHELLRGGVGLARNWGASGDSKTPFGYYTTSTLQGFSASPRVDYIAATYHVTKPDDRDWFPPDMPAWPKVQAATKPVLTWTRQTLFMKDDTPRGPHYLLLRDTTSGGQPTTWQFWTLSEKIGTPVQAKDNSVFLADKPGNKILPARELLASNRYTAVGQFNVDLEYFIARPASTPRSTLRYGGIYRNVPEFQDVLHLQLPGDGEYFVALYPRMRGEEAPVFSTLGEGKIIKVAGTFGIDYGFLSRTSGKATAEGAAFEGTAGAVQQRNGASVLSLAAPGKVSYQQYSLAAPIAASLHIEPKAITINISGGAKSTSLTLGLPGKWRLAKKTSSAELKSLGKGQYQLTVPSGTTSLQLIPA